ncbi:MAG: ATP-binding protein, partial [Dehalococcoidia bacterium]
MQRLRIRLFGPPRVEIDGSALNVDTRKAVALLAYLVTTNAPHSRDALATLLWPESDDAGARSSLRRTLSVLRKALDGRWITVRRGTLSFEPVDAWSDIGEFREILDQCNAHVHDALERCTFCVERLTSLADLYTGDFMSGFSLRDSPEFEEWQTLQAESLRRDFDSILDRLVRAHVQRSELPTAIAFGRRRLAIDTLNETAHSTLMQLFALVGDRSAALRQYRECVRVLNEELGVTPLEETTRLYQTIVSGEVAALPVLAAAIAELPPDSSAAGVVERGVRQLPLTGREAEWAALLQAYACITEDGRETVIEGEAGIGKTRLARELVEHVRQHGGRAIACQCYEGEVTLPYAPIIALLRAAQALPEAATRLTALKEHDLVEAARILPELSQIAPGLPAPPALDSPAARTRFFDGLIAVLTASLEGEAPGLVLIDDLHWADEASLDLITYLTRRLQSRPLCVVLTWRSEELPAGHRLRRLLAERQREGGAEHLELRRLDPSAVQRLVASVVAGDADPSPLAERLFQETDGLPFFIAQYLAATVDHQRPEAPWPVPTSVRDLLRSRVAQVSETDLQILTAAAVIGRSFSFEVLRGACGRSEEEAITSIEDLVRLGFLVPSTAGEGGKEPSYDFSHERLRAFVYEETSSARRRLLHRRVAAALARGPSGRRSGAVAGTVAQHYRLAGQ